MSTSEETNFQRWKIGLDNGVVESLWNSFCSDYSETVEVETRCTHCTNFDLHDRDRHRKDLPNRIILERSYIRVLYQSQSCWLCRFLCRIVASNCTYEEFSQSVQENHSLEITDNTGWWEWKLLLEPGETPIPAYSLSIKNYSRNEGDKILMSFEGCFTHFRFDSLPSRRFRWQADSDDRYSLSNAYGHLSTVVDWLEFCDSHHEKCYTRAIEGCITDLDLIVIDVETRTLQRLPKDESYFALSYVWGKDPLDKQTSWMKDAPTLRELLQQVKVNTTLPLDLPPTIGDAVELTLALGGRYLWVDLLCIDQEDASARSRTMKIMDKIFIKALLTLCILDGDMFSGVASMVFEPPSVGVNITTTTSSCRYQYIDLPNYGDVLSGSDWAHRAWTFQEGELSARRLCFSHETIFLVCKEEIFHYDLDLDRSNPRVKGALTPGGNHFLPLSFDLDLHTWSFRTYADMTYSYKNRSTTFIHDTWIALSGALQRISENLKVKFYAAMPSHDIHNALLWQWQARFDKDQNSDDPRIAGLPTWSWVAWRGVVHYRCWLQDPKPIDLKSKGIFSLYNFHDGEILYYNAVRVRARAKITFIDQTTDTSFAVLSITTTSVTFRVAYAQERRNSPPSWYLLTADGQLILRDSAFSHHDFSHFSSELCSFLVHQATSTDLLNSGLSTLEFILLQQWSPLAATIPPVPLPGFPSDDQPPASNKRFTNTVWAMAIRRQKDSRGQQLAVLCIPAKVWYAAKPIQTTISIA